MNERKIKKDERDKYHVRNSKKAYSYTTSEKINSEREGGERDRDRRTWGARVWVGLSTIVMYI